MRARSASPASGVAHALSISYEIGSGHYRPAQCLDLHHKPPAVFPFYGASPARVPIHLRIPPLTFPLSLCPSPSLPLQRFSSDPVIVTPDISDQQLGPDDELLIVATDGLWDVLPPLETLRLAKSRFKDGNSAEQVWGQVWGQDPGMWEKGLGEEVRPRCGAHFQVASRVTQGGASSLSETPSIPSEGGGGPHRGSWP